MIHNHNPVTIPVHWVEVTKLLSRDVELGTLREFPANEPMVWMHKIVMVKKKNGSPRRTVDMQRLNNAPLRLKNPLSSPLPEGHDCPQELVLDCH